MKTRFKRNREQGLALVGILLMLTVLALVASLMLMLGSSNLRMARNDIESEKALNAAEAGLAVALEEYIRDQSYEGEPNAVGFGTTGLSYTVSLYDSSTGSPDGAAVPDGHTLLLATGSTERGLTRTVSAMVTARLTTEAHDNALLAGDRVFLENAFLESYDSELSTSAYAFYASSSVQSQIAQLQTATLNTPWGTLSANFKSVPAQISYSRQKSSQIVFKSVRSQVASAPAAAAAPPPPQQLTYNREATTTTTFDTSGTNSNGGNAHIAVNSDESASMVLGYGSEVDGELRIPDGAEAETVIRNQSGEDTLGVNDAYSPPAMVPVRLPLAPGDENINWNGSSSGGSFITDGELQPGAYGDLVVDGGTLVLNSAGAKGKENGKDLYVFRSVTLKNGGKIVLPKEAKSNKVTAGLYIDEKLEIVDGSVENKTNDPSRLQMYVADDAPVNIDVREDSEMMLYAPGSDVKVTGGDVFGNVVGKDIEITSGATIHYDKQLAKVQPDPWGNGGYYAYWKSYQRR